jgi:hypothetical protein
LRLSPKILPSLLVLLLGACASAQTISGTVTNGTTKKPGAGDEVILIKLGAGMEEVAHTKTDASGKFSFKLDDAGSPHLIRVVHQDVTYHQMAPPGMSTADVEVFDVAKKIDGLGVTADVMRIQAEPNQLDIVRLFAVNNTSNPPKTQMKDANFEFFLPDGAKITQGMAKTANGQPLNSEPIPQRDKNRYAFDFPLRPGETQFQVAYTVPYSGSLQIQPKALYPLEHFVVMLPKSMQFTADSGAQYQSMDDPQQKDAIVQVAQRVEPGQALGFKLAGTGTLNLAGTSDSGGPESSQAGMGGRDSRPGGGLGPPIDAPDPLQRYRWYILGGFAAVLIVGALYVSSRQGMALATAGRSAAVSDLDASPVPATSSREMRAAAAAPASTAPATPPTSVPAASTPAATATPASKRPMILDALKEELFELELEHKQGRISQAEYEKAKAALDATLERALKRQNA